MKSPISIITHLLAVILGGAVIYVVSMSGAISTSKFPSVPDSASAYEVEVDGMGMVIASEPVLLPTGQVFIETAMRGKVVIPPNYKVVFRPTGRSLKYEREAPNTPMGSPVTMPNTPPAPGPAGTQGQPNN